MNGCENKAHILPHTFYEAVQVALKGHGKIHILDWLTIENVLSHQGSGNDFVQSAHVFNGIMEKSSHFRLCIHQLKMWYFTKGEEVEMILFNQTMLTAA